MVPIFRRLGRKLMLKLLRKAKNVGAIPIFLDTVNIYTKNETAHQGANDNLVLEMQTTDREKFFNYFRMTSKLFKELLAL